MGNFKDLEIEIRDAENYLETLRFNDASESIIQIDEQQRYIENLKEELMIFESGDKSDSFSREEIRYGSSPNIRGGGLAVIIGHCSFKEGACGVLPISDCEFLFNTTVAEKILHLCNEKNIRCEVFTREWGRECLISSTYKYRVLPWKPKCTVELHYNSGSPNPPYSVTLYAREDSEKWALELQNQIHKVYDRPSNQSKKVWKLAPGQNGYINTVSLPNSALIEPFFGSVLSDAIMGKTKTDELASAIVAAYSNYID